MSKPRALGSTFDDHDEGTIETIQYLTITSSDIRPLRSFPLCSAAASDDSNIHLALFSSQVFLTSQTIRSLPGQPTLELSVIKDDTRSFKSSQATEPSQTSLRERERERDVFTLLFKDCNRLEVRGNQPNWWRLLLHHWNLSRVFTNSSCFRCPQSHCRLFSSCSYLTTRVESHHYVVYGHFFMKF